MYFSYSAKGFYRNNLDYDLPSDAIPITAEQHIELLTAFNSGCIVFEDLSFTSSKPSNYHEWDYVTENWVDVRSPEDILLQTRSDMPDLDQRDFRKLLRDNNIFDNAKDYVYSSGNGYLEDAWEFSKTFKRLDPFVIQASEALGVTPEQVDEMWLSL